MVNLKKIDEKEVVVLNQPWTAEEKELFSDYLRSRKKTKPGEKGRQASSPKGRGANHRG
jgi:hypothetical protein